MQSTTGGSRVCVVTGRPSALSSSVSAPSCRFSRRLRGSKSQSLGGPGPWPPPPCDTEESRAKPPARKRPRILTRRALLPCLPRTPAPPSPQDPGIWTPVRISLRPGILRPRPPLGSSVPFSPALSSLDSGVLDPRLSFVIQEPVPPAPSPRPRDFPAPSPRYESIRGSKRR